MQDVIKAIKILCVCIFKDLVEWNEHLNHTLYKQNFYDKSSSKFAHLMIPWKSARRPPVECEASVSALRLLLI